MGATDIRRSKRLTSTSAVASAKIAALGPKAAIRKRPLLSAASLTNTAVGHLQVPVSVPMVIAVPVAPVAAPVPTPAAADVLPLPPSSPAPMMVAATPAPLAAATPLIVAEPTVPETVVVAPSVAPAVVDDVMVVDGSATALPLAETAPSTCDATRPRRESLHKRVNRWLLPGEQLYTRSRLAELIRCIRKLAKLMGFEYDFHMLLPTVMYLDRFVGSYGRINSTTCYRLFLVSAVVTLKFWGEERYGIDFKLCSYVSGIPVQEIAQLERVFLGPSGLQYNLFLRPEELDTYTQAIDLAVA
jgi:hypothetical protein